MVSCFLHKIRHARLDAANGGVASTTEYSTDPSDVGGTFSTLVFKVEALENAVVLARGDSDEVWMHPRYSYHALSSAKRW